MATLFNRFISQWLKARRRSQLYSLERAGFLIKLIQIIDKTQHKQKFSL